MEKNTIYIVVGLLAGVIIGLFITYSLLTPQYYQYYGYPMGPMMHYPMQYPSDTSRYPQYGQSRYYPPGCCQGPTNFTSNGESIYFTGINENGERIPFTGGPYWLLNHGGSCVNCHGRDGKGGIIPMMCNVQTPDIRYSALTGGEHGHAFTDEDIKNAIVKGIDDGDQLDWCMPRWQMSNKDLSDTIEYLKVLQ
jgi:cytochrome c oxidase subunit 2